MKPVACRSRTECKAAVLARSRHKALRAARRQVQALKKRLVAKDKRIAVLKLKLAIVKPLARVAARTVRW